GGNVNLAARLETAAESDNILISHETYSLVKDNIECQYIGELNYKGLKEPIKTYKVHKALNKSFSTETEFIKITEDSVVLKNIVIDPKKLTKDQKDKLISSLRMAISYTEEIAKTDE
ncbi:MAG TPA: adenylate/guanylate cyclase domain-containing protein, partial [Spirochaetota bacterium]|nr:adenylate/guanylate cyclase domain-containing protein [Spirochaetota bacterium]